MATCYKKSLKILFVSSAILIIVIIVYNMKFYLPASVVNYFNKFNSFNSYIVLIKAVQDLGYDSISLSCYAYFHAWVLAIVFLFLDEHLVNENCALRILNTFSRIIIINIVSYVVNILFFAFGLKIIEAYNNFYTNSTNSVIGTIVFMVVSAILWFVFIPIGAKSVIEMCIFMALYPPIEWFYKEIIFFYGTNRIFDFIYDFPATKIIIYILLSFIIDFLYNICCEFLVDCSENNP